MRRIVLAGTVVLSAALAAGCSSAVPHSADPGGPITASATSSTPSPSASSAPTGQASPSVRATTRPSRKPPAPPILGPKGFGALKLGMTSKQATATGLIVPWRGTEESGCSLSSHLRGGTGGGNGGNTGEVMLSGSTGVEVIDAYPGVDTPEGIHLGSTTAQMRKAYPDWTNFQDQDPHAEGIGAADVPGNPQATYRIWTQNGKVYELTLQLNLQNCYE
jgi:hypothetical protein